MSTDTAVIMARGLGTRMQRVDPAAGQVLSEHQAQVAGSGLKGLIPDNRGRPFLDHLLTNLADAGIRRVVLVVAPEHQALSEHFAANPPRRLSLAWAVQTQANGTAAAVLAASHAVGDQPFLVLNADNLYPTEALRALLTVPGWAAIGFQGQALLEKSNFAAERLKAFATFDTSDDGYLLDLLEKPGNTPTAVLANSLVSMNLWRLDSRFFPLASDIPLSQRGEYELPAAITLGVARGIPVRVLSLADGVLDLSSQGDIAAVMRVLDQREVDR